MEPFLVDNSTCPPHLRREAVTLVLDAMSRKYPLKYEFTGPPRTDGKTIWLGDIDPRDPDFFPLTLGSGIHELMHVRKTDLASIRHIAVTTMQARLLNVLEDVRIDALAVARHHGYRVWRDVLTQRLEERGMLLAASTEPMEPALGLPAWLHAALSTKMDFAWAKRHEPRLRRAVVGWIGKEATAELLIRADAVHHCQSTREVLDLAFALDDFWRCSRDAH